MMVELDIHALHYLLAHSSVSVKTLGVTAANRSMMHCSLLSFFSVSYIPELYHDRQYISKLLCQNIASRNHDQHALHVHQLHAHTVAG